MLNQDSLPTELLEAIFSHLRQTDLAKCMLVNKFWSSAVRAQTLWRSISITTLEELERFETPEYQETLLRNAHHVRELQTHYADVVERIVRRHATGLAISNNCRMTQLLRLDLSKMKLVRYREVSNQSYFHANWEPPLNLEQEQDFLCLIQSNPRLQFLSIGSYIDNRDQLLAILTDVNLPRLKSLDLFRDHLGLSCGSSASVECTRTFFETCPMSLREISIRLNVPYPYEESDDEEGDDEEEVVVPPLPPPRDTSVEPCLPHPDLETIVVQGQVCESVEDLEYILLKCLQSCSRKLKTVQTTWMAHHRIDLLMAVLRDLRSAKLYVVYMYWDYKKENQFKIHRVYKNLDEAIKYAESICEKGESYREQYVNHRGLLFDSKEKDSRYGRIAIDEASYFDN
ncbi:hypothetical protein BG005_003000 [Podila minutissima]|nr:hypothetical protein BG005_003000 [Podila minutissima]